MVMKMIKWSTSKKFQVRVKLVELEGFHGFFEPEEEHEEQDEGKKGEKVAMVEMKWKGPKIGLSSLRRVPKQQRNMSSETIVKRGDSIKLDEEFKNVCSFSTSQKDNSFIPFEVLFNLLYGQRTEPMNKLSVMGTVSLNLSELASQSEFQIEKKLPIALQNAINGSEATLLISVSFMEIRSTSTQDSSGIVQQLSFMEDGFMKRVKNLTSYVSSKKKKKKKKSQDLEDEGESDGKQTKDDTDDSANFDSEDSPENELTQSSITSCEDESLTQTGIGFLQWRKRKLGFRSEKRRSEPLIKKTNDDEEDVFVDRVHVRSSDDDLPFSRRKIHGVTKNSPSKLDWQKKELISRDGKSKLKANVFFASIDQRSEEAGGESACTALVAVVANWLQSNPNTMPTMSQFDSLIKEGSLEWRKLCGNEAYLKCFPDKHFDLETVLKANVKPLSIASEKTFIGFFCPENFESLKGSMSFDDIWDEIRRSREDGKEHVYIVSWNDHFFVLKVESNAYYIIDTLGERLFEGCKKAYILKFDESSLMHGLPLEDKRRCNDNRRKENEVLICNGKECCKVFISRFLASIPLRELEIEEKKGKVSSVLLHKRLQIEFHYTIPSSF